MASPSSDSIIALDYGNKRVGVASATSDDKIANPLMTLDNNESLMEDIKQITDQYNADIIVVGLPRSLAGYDTEQTKLARDFANNLREFLRLPVYLVDEAGTSLRAKELLGKSGNSFAKSDVDSLAAALILEDYLSS